MVPSEEVLFQSWSEMSCLAKSCLTSSDLPLAGSVPGHRPWAHFCALQFQLHVCISSLARILAAEYQKFNLPVQRASMVSSEEFLFWSWSEMR